MTYFTVIDEPNILPNRLTARECYAVGKHNWSNQNWGRAIQFLTKALNIDPTFVSAYWCRSECYDAISDHEKCRRDSSHSWFYQGIQHMEDNEPKFAVECFTNAIHYHPCWQEAYQWRMDAHKCSNNLDAACRDAMTLASLRAKMNGVAT